jgi:hypothetical protein
MGQHAQAQAIWLWVPRWSAVHVLCGLLSFEYTCVNAAFSARGRCSAMHSAAQGLAAACSYASGASTLVRARQ